MATKSKLEQAVEQQMAHLNPAQKEIVKSQLSRHKKNKARIFEIDETLKSPMSTQLHPAERMALTSERSQLSTSNTEIERNLFNQLKDTD